MLTSFRHIRAVPNRSTTFGTFTSKTRPAVKNGFHRFLRFLLRSGTYASHISYEQAHENTPGIPAKYSGWRGGIFLGATSAGTIFVINLIFTIWAGAKSKSGMRIGTLYTGDCGTVHKADAWVHIAINAMGTLLLGASNYTMQCLASPTRSEVDAAHAMGKYMDVGLPSFRNLHGWKKKILFTLLVLSTLPLHFLWNSAVFTTTQRLDYNVYVVTPDFLTSTSVDCMQNVTTGVTPPPRYATEYNILKPLNATDLDYDNRTRLDTLWWSKDMCGTSRALQANASKGLLTRLDNAACINAYGPGNGLMKGYANLLAVTQEKPADTNHTVLMSFRYEAFISNYTANRWVCDGNYLANNNYKCKYKELATKADSWSLSRPKATEAAPWNLQPSDEWPIDYCLAEPTHLTGMCQLQYSLVIMLAVLFANAIKLFCIVYVLTTHLDTVLATIGDAISSFLENPDPVTINRPFLSRGQARKFNMTSSGEPAAYRPYRLRWWQAPSWARWVVTLFFCIIAISITGKLLTYGNESFLDSAAGEYKSPYDLSFGSYSEFAILTILASGQSNLTAKDFDSNSILIAMVALANLPQVIVSCLYFAYNTIYTSMVSADEWSRFTKNRKALRTTDPRGEQRSTYWLSLPWTYALPLALASSVLHWLISQSLFISRTEVLDTLGEPEPISYMNVGYNPLAILLALLFGVAMVLVMILNGFKKLTEGSILVGNNSLAIAAACQREKDEGAEKRKVMWGAVRHEAEDGTPGHCCFSSEHVEMPRIGDKYL
ncbi:hypothetical protein BKA65DRAFT_501524 [Rhexocercosporidium sp. MPI-PUGE-AT-0058]|nr:hypothetical protein BKA65DRAFT_501524 [Rhexocercosporidium sp. MPI-PUGE-AT-0058]